MFNLSRQRDDYHRIFSCSIEDKVVNYVVERLITSGVRYSGIPKKSHIKSLLNKIASFGIKDQIELDENKIDLRYPSLKDDVNFKFFDTEIYSTYLVTNLREQMNLLADLSEEEEKIKEMLFISPIEKRQLDQLLIPKVENKLGRF